MSIAQNWPQHPPTCRCGCQDDPCIPPLGPNVTECWTQIEAIKRIIEQIIGDMGGPVKTGPIQGVIDGSDAKPGEVGEFIPFYPPVFAFSGPQGVLVSTTISAGVVPPGDWDITGALRVTVPVNAAQTYISPFPNGGVMHGNLSSSFGIAGTDFTEYPVTIMQPSRLNVATPTLLPIRLDVWPGTTAGNAGITLFCRRRR